MDFLATLRDVVSPPPLSPIFQENGIFEGLNEDLTLSAIGILVLFVVDKVVISQWLDAKSRYFALHVCANAVSAVAAFPDVYRLFADPLRAFSGPSNTMVANSAGVAIHLYHCIAFPLAWADIFHHALFVTILCGLAIPYKQIGGCANNFGCFFLSGLPGGIIYANMVCVKEGVMSKMTEKRWASRINTWLRAPPMTVYAFVGYMGYIYGTATSLPLWAVLVVTFLHFFNGQYYMEMAIGSYHANLEKEKLVKKPSVGASKED